MLRRSRILSFPLHLTSLLSLKKCDLEVSALLCHAVILLRDFLKPLESQGFTIYEG